MCRVSWTVSTPSWAVLQKSLRPDPKAPPADGTTLDGATVFSLQQRLNGLLSAQVVQPGGVPHPG